ncbi:2-oxoglutarate dehydrogenase E1 component, partial [bacterium]|nr:2-oxoglutarate dehydrogenase E1 component [bacterium]
TDLLTVFQASDQVGLEPCTLNEIIIHLEQTYCQSIGIEYQYIRHPERVEWIRKNIELKNRPQFSKDQKKHILHKLNQATNTDVLSCIIFIYSSKEIFSLFSNSISKD